ncbi:hypothetical protein Daus18300_008040 [Diaporthe australafricana]|uniref:glycine--tRNA ligase n=1 Tax=Diaporthe australafricana TaxID=127596 RepID=A0ABR3WK44_9PEZI
MTQMTTLKGQVFDRPLFASVMKRRFFFTESIEACRVARNWKGDNRGFYDYGPPGCAVQTNLVDLWRKHFVLEENMLEIDCSVITPEPVLKTSGHVDKFADWMCKDPTKGEYLRADHLVETVLEARLASGSRGPDKNSEKLAEANIVEFNHILASIDNYTGDQLGELIKRLHIRNPVGNGEVLPPVPFNLMFKSTVGPSAAAPVYLRPETAQGQFLNFKKLLNCNQGSMPFASASVGKSYRNEISPRTGLLRVREFLLAEIEHYVDPDNKDHGRFPEVINVEMPLLDRDTQLAGSTAPEILTVGEAVTASLIDNQTLGYFLARIMLFLIEVGVDPSKIRFRQHLANEMAHYACDCWDAELLTSYGWIECVGCADRSAYDLSVHSNYTSADLKVRESMHGGSIQADVWEATLKKKLTGPRFKKDAKIVQDSLDAIDQSEVEALAMELNEKGVVSVGTSRPMSDGRTSVELSGDLLSTKKETRVQTTREYTPNVIEPSFGIGRALYSLLEHVYWNRPQDAARAPQFGPIINKISARLRKLGVSNNVDSSSASIGRRYARNDELGTPLGITVDFDTVADGSLTLRDRVSTSQVRGSEDEVILAVKHMVDGVERWEDVAQRLPTFEPQG